MKTIEATSRKTMLFLVAAIATSGCATPEFATNEEMKHEFIVALPGMKKEELFEKTLKWIALNFRSAKAVVEYQDKETGSVIGNGSTKVTLDGLFTPYTADLLFTMNVDIRDEKARVRFLNLETYSATGSAGIIAVPNYAIWHRPAQQEFTDLVIRLTAFLRAEQDKF
jgi:Domain of unknown function (DUF4468) with TBP-like fold